MTSGETRLEVEAGVRLFVDRVGSGAHTLLVLNGFYLFDDFHWLAEDRTVVGLDLRNRGRSDHVHDPSKLARGVEQDVDDIEAVRRRLDVDRVDLLAHSYAGVVAVLYALRHRSSVGRIVLLGPMQPDSGVEYPAHLANHDDVLDAFAAAAGRLQARRQEMSEREFCEEFWTLLLRIYVFDPADAGKLRHWAGCHLETELHFLRYWTEALLPSIRRLRFDAQDLAAATLPVLVVHGTSDRSAPYGGGRDWTRRLPNARLLTVENAAHAPWIEAPDAVRGAVRTFLDGGWPDGAETVDSLEPRTNMTEQENPLSPDAFGGRRPTSHERMTGLPWDASYHGGAAPWDIERPQPAIVRLAAEEAFEGPVLDAGCGSGENALHLASLGLEVVGFDVAETALACARAKAVERGLDATFVLADALHLERLDRTFPTVLDCGLFHTFDEDERARYVASLAGATAPGGTAYVLCFSDAGPDTGPHPVRERDLRAAFAAGGGWRILSVEADRVHTRFHDHGAPAWLAAIRRLPA